MIEILASIPESNLVMAAGRGKVTGYDYEIVLIPAIEAALKAHHKIRLLYHLGEEFNGFSPEAVWDDAKFGLGHLRAFEAIAVVTDVVWIADGVKLFSVFMRCPVKVFGNARLSEAKEWVITAPGWRSLSEE